MFYPHSLYITILNLIFYHSQIYYDNVLCCSNNNWLVVSLLIDINHSTNLCCRLLVLFITFYQKLPSQTDRKTVGEMSQNRVGLTFEALIHENKKRPNNRLQVKQSLSVFSTTILVLLVQPRTITVSMPI